MENLELIENYFKGSNDEVQKKQFEKKIMEDTSFAEEVAFYVSANSALQKQVQAEKKKRLREIYNEQKVINIKQPVRSMWKYMAAASVIVAAVLITWFFSGNKQSPQQLANAYVEQNFKTLAVTMGSQEKDKMQKGLDLYNNHKPEEALSEFETIMKNNSSNSEAKKYAGIVSLQLNNYDKALQYFTMLAADTGLYSNPGKFYEAITLLKRNKDGDKETAKILLTQVSDENLDGKTQATEWLKKF